MPNLNRRRVANATNKHATAVGIRTAHGAAGVAAVNYARRVGLYNSIEQLTTQRIQCSVI